LSHVVTVNFDCCEPSQYFMYLFKFMLVEVQLLFGKILVFFFLFRTFSKYYYSSTTTLNIETDIITMQVIIEECRW
jgi:hypothetical protein